MYHHLIAAAQTGGNLITPTNMRYLGFGLLILIVLGILRSLGVIGGGGN
jgi:hypothetical protein